MKILLCDWLTLSFHCDVTGKIARKAIPNASERTAFDQAAMECAIIGQVQKLLLKPYKAILTDERKRAKMGHY